MLRLSQCLLSRGGSVVSGRWETCGRLSGGLYQGHQLPAHPLSLQLSWGFIYSHETCGILLLQQGLNPGAWQ